MNFRGIPLYNIQFNQSLILIHLYAPKQEKSVMLFVQSNLKTYDED
jgi:hypothetical protein